MHGVTEFEVQATTYMKLKWGLKEYTIRGEYAHKGCRPDISIFRDKELIAVVEVKRSATSKAKEQKSRYELLLGVPCIYIKGYSDAFNAVEIVKAVLV